MKSVNEVSKMKKLLTFLEQGLRHFLLCLIYIVDQGPWRVAASRRYSGQHINLPKSV